MHFVDISDDVDHSVDDNNTRPLNENNNVQADYNNHIITQRDVTKNRGKIRARVRRANENQEFINLKTVLPLPKCNVPMLDKGSTMRLTTSYLKLRQVFPYGEFSFVAIFGNDK